MCTLTFVPTDEGYVAGMNRDERLTRPVAIPPQVLELDGATAIYPREVSGGTWIGCNNHGNLLALLNWNDVTPPVDVAQLRTRGLLIPKLIVARDLTQTRALYARLNLHNISPFRLIGAFLEERVVTEWRSSGSRKQEFQFPWDKRHWFSSSVSDAMARRERGRACQHASMEFSTTPAFWIRKLHQSHDPVPGPFSVCVHRKDAATVSYSEVRCSGMSISMNYRNGSPCLNDEFDSETSLAMGPAHALANV
jgi:hypothetical protein